MVFIALFTVAIISFAGNFATDNNSAISLSNDTLYRNINDSMQGNLTVFYSDANVSTTAMYESTISPTSEATEGGSSFKAGSGTTLAMVRDSIKVAYERIFGSDSGFSIFMTSLIAILGYISAMYIYKAWAGRNP
jgi:hypothetical protein